VDCSDLQHTSASFESHNSITSVPVPRVVFYLFVSLCVSVIA